MKDLGFPSSTDRSMLKMLKFIGFIDQNGKPLEAYRKFLDHTQSKKIIAEQLRTAYDDLFNANKSAEKMSQNELKGWFRSKTGVGEAVAEKIASTFKTFAEMGDFSHTKTHITDSTSELKNEQSIPLPIHPGNQETNTSTIGLVYRFEIHLPDTQNIDTYRAIFKAIKEELMK